MKKIIIVNNNLKTGGVQISLLNLLKEISPLYDITLLLFNSDTEYTDMIPKNVKIIRTTSPFKYLGVSSAEASRCPVTFMGRSFWAVLTKMFGISFVTKLMAVFQKKIKGYDIAISFLHEGKQKTFYGGCNDFVLRRIETDYKIAWIHCDFSLSGANNIHSKKIYQQFDKIIACSEGAKKVFVKCLPELEERCMAVRNCNDYIAIKANAYPPIKYESGYIHIVTVARLAVEKGIDRMLQAVAVAKKSGYKLKYHIVGSGKDSEALQELSKTLQIEDYVIFYGNQQNPYPYIAAADLFVLPSYHEAAPMVFDEAMALGVPILATETTSTDEMIIQTGAGYVCENSQNGITSALLDVLSKPQELKQITYNLRKREYTNKNSVNLLKLVL